MDAWHIDLIAIVSLAYFNAGMNVLLFHTGLEPVDQPGYVSLGLPRIVFAGATWPLTAGENRELGWFGILFVAALFVFALLWSLLGLFISSRLIRGAILVVTSFTPIVGAPCGLLGSLIWRACARKFGLRIPFGMERMRRH